MREDGEVLAICYTFFVLFAIIQVQYLKEIWKHILLYFIKNEQVDTFKRLTCNKIDPAEYYEKNSGQERKEMNPEDVMDQEFVKRVDEEQDIENEKVIM